MDVEEAFDELIRQEKELMKENTPVAFQPSSSPYNATSGDYPDDLDRDNSAEVYSTSTGSSLNKAQSPKTQSSAKVLHKPICFTAKFGWPHSFR